MSTNLYWRPVKPQKKNSLPNGLKYVLARRYWGSDGSISDGPSILIDEDIPFLEGVSLAGQGEVKDGADMLIDLIQKHGEVEVWTEG